MSIVKRIATFVPPGDLKSAAIVSCLLILPFIALEWTNTQGSGNTFPAALFAFMWSLTALFVLIVIPVLRVRGERSSTADIVTLLSRVALAILVAGLWLVIVQDQMPCFLGVPNCD